jgi:hypothetical protein
MTSRRHEFTAAETADLLDELDVRLRRRGVAASIFVVGGAAIAANQTRRDRVTEDVDALTRDTAVLEEAQALARERGLPEDWLNPNAGMWMPPLPGGVLDQPAEPGLRVTYADDGFLLATKLIAQRAKDADDVVALADRLGLSTATPEQLEAHIRSYYTDPAPLEFIVDGSDVDREISLLAYDAPGCFTARGLRPSATSTPLKRARTPKPSGFGAASRARNALPGPHVTPRATDPRGRADDGSCLERGVRGFPSSPRSHARSPVGLGITGIRPAHGPGPGSVCGTGKLLALSAKSPNQCRTKCPAPGLEPQRSASTLRCLS